MTQPPPSLERSIRTDWRSIHGNPVGQQTEHRKSRYETSANRPVGLLIPPPLSHLIGGVPLNQQREEDVSVRYTRHSDE